MNQALVESQKLWQEAGLPEDFLVNLQPCEKPDPIVDSSFKLGSVAQITIGLAGLSAAYLHYLKTGKSQTVSVDSRHAIIEFKSENYFLIDDKRPKGDLFDRLAGLYRTKDGFVRIHTNFPHHKKGILDLLRCGETRDSVQEALLEWHSQDFEDQAAANKMCATKARTFDEWDIHPQAIALKGVKPVEIVKVGEAPKRDLSHQFDLDSALGGVRVLDLTRVLAGPIAGRTLAAYGAEVLHITSPNLPDLPHLDMDTSRGKRNAQLDLTVLEEKAKLENLAKASDVFLQGYRPGGLTEKGFGVENLTEARPGLIYASLTAYGWEGPWKDRRGFDSLVQNATGFGYAEALAFANPTTDSNQILPRPLPCQAIDHAAGYFLAYGINVALCKTILEGGSWEVRVSLAGVAQWIRSLGRVSLQDVDKEELTLPGDPFDGEIIANTAVFHQAKPDNKISFDDEYSSQIKAIRHAASLSLTPAKEKDAPLTLDTHSASWIKTE